MRTRLTTIIPDHVDECSPRLNRNSIRFVVDIQRDLPPLRSFCSLQSTLNERPHEAASIGGGVMDVFHRIDRRLPRRLPLQRKQLH